jgi:uncharacterized protein (UPF0128 family)
MTMQNSPSKVAARRGELLAELFLQELEPKFISRSTTADWGYDLLVGFANKKGGINTFAVQVKATERPPGERFQIMRDTFDRFANSNIPGLLLVADVKQNHLYYAWLTAKRPAGTASISIALTEIDDKSKELLRRQVRDANGMLVAG